MNDCPCGNCRRRVAPCLWEELRKRAGLKQALPQPPVDAPMPPKPHSETDRDEETDK